MSKERKLSQSELSAILNGAAKKVTVGGRYAHYKQYTYIVLTIALRENDNEPLVVYQAEYGNAITFTRPVSEWVQLVEQSGKSVPRFTKIKI